MRSFEHFNTAGGRPCPVCNTQDDKETVLVGIVGTEEDGNMEAMQVHLECIELYYYPPGLVSPDKGAFAQIIPNHKET